MNGTLGRSAAGTTVEVESARVFGLASAITEPGPAIVRERSVGVSDPVEPKPESTSVESSLSVGVVRKLMLILEEFVFEGVMRNLDINLDV